MPSLVLPCGHIAREQVRGSAALRSGGCVWWAYCAQCNLFAMDDVPEISSQSRQEVEEEIRSFVKVALERDRAAAAAHND